MSRYAAALLVFAAVLAVPARPVWQVETLIVPTCGRIVRTILEPH